ncbi:MAG: hypothetical protein IH600_17830 [Bacteroidetes bacterium]|nr:hypothetical protein [Bacteroidota bacterium]
MIILEAFRGNRAILNSLIAAFLCLASPQLNAQWQRVETLEGITVQDFAVTATGVLYTASSRADGLYYSTDQGISWVHRIDPDVDFIVTLTASGESLYGLVAFGFGPGSTRKIFRLHTPNSQIEWIPSPPNAKVCNFASAADGTIYATGGDDLSPDSVYVSSDTGATWRSLCAAYSSDITSNALRVDEHNTIWSSADGSIAYFDEAAGTWIQWAGQYHGYSQRLRNFVAANGDAYMNNGSRITKHTAATDSFTVLYDTHKPEYSPLEFWRMADGQLLVSQSTPGALSRSVLLLRSTDDGATWSTISTELKDGIEFLGEHDGVLYCNHGGMIVATEDHGESFRFRNTGIAAKYIWHFETRGNRIHVQSLRYAISSDGGATWEYPDISPGMSPMGLQITSDGTWYENIGYFRISRDGAKTWEAVWGGLSEYSVSAFLALDDVVVVLGMDGTIRRSVDRGISWEAVHKTNRFATNLIEVHGALYAIHSDELIRSTDRGITWSSALLPAVQNAVLTGNDRMLLLSASGILWASTDLGDSWTPLPHDKLTQGITTFAVNRDGTFAAIRMDNTPGAMKRDVIVSLDDGRSWYAITENLPPTFTNGNFTPAADLAFTRPNTLVVNVASRGLYTYSEVPAVIVCPQGLEGTLDLALWPTITTSEVQYRVSAPMGATVTVYGPTGAQMYNAEMEAGSAARVLDTFDWPAGRYFLRASAGGTVIVRPFVLLR